MKNKNTAATAISCTVIIGSKPYPVIAWDNMRKGQFLTKNPALAVVPEALQADAFDSANGQLAVHVGATCESVIKVGKTKQAIIGNEGSRSVNDTVSVNYNMGKCQDADKVNALVNAKVAAFDTASADLLAMAKAQVADIDKASAPVVLGDTLDGIKADKLVAEAKAEAKGKKAA